MKKFVSVLMALLLLLGAVAAQAEEVEPMEYTNLTVGTINSMSGNFMGGMWKATTSDIDVQKLLHAYSPVKWDAEFGNYAYDEAVVSGVVKLQQGDGSHSYYITINEGLVYSDGTPITARDYVFSVLLASCPEMAAIGGNTSGFAYLKGAAAYSSGEAEMLTGVGLVNDTTFRLDISADALPYFFEMCLLDVTPMPIHVIAPGCAVAGDANGTCIRDEDGQDTLFTADLLRETLLDAESGYMTHPSVVSGPYTLASYADQTAEFDVNPEYLGNLNGTDQMIPHLTFTFVEGDEAIDALADGRIGLLNKAVLEENIDEGMALARGNGYTMANYARCGLSFLSFCCEQKAVSEAEVRRAIAGCLDADALTEAYTGNYGIRVNGYYGIGQWMVQILGGTAAPVISEDDDGTEAQAWEELSLDELEGYELDPEAAAAALEKAGWALNEDGVRQKEMDGEIVTLDLTLCYPEGNRMGALLEEHFVPYLAEAGIRLTLEPVENETLMAQYHKTAPRDCDMIYLATNFGAVFDPAATFAVDGAENYFNVRDEELAASAAKLARVEPGETLDYCRNWMEFQKICMEAMPAIPLYTNVYFDFYTGSLRNYRIPEHSSWAEAIVEAYMSDAPIGEEVGETLDISGNGEDGSDETIEIIE